MRLATILWPKLIFADEPTTALDVVVQRGVIQMLKDVQQKEGSTLVLITHDIGVHANLADRIGILYAGKLVEEADTKTILESPRHPYTRYLIESLPSLDSREERLGDSPGVRQRWIVHRAAAASTNAARWRRKSARRLNQN